MTELKKCRMCSEWVERRTRDEEVGWWVCDDCLGNLLRCEVCRKVYYRDDQDWGMVEDRFACGPCCDKYYDKQNG